MQQISLLETATQKLDDAFGKVFSKSTKIEVYIGLG